MTKVRFGLIGGGWRAEFFTRIAAAMPERFEVAGAYLRDPGKAAAFGAKWDLPVCDSLEALAALEVDFVVVSVKAAAHPEVFAQLHALGLAVLAETPAATDLAALHQIWGLVERGLRLHVAEQYWLQPLHAARLALINGGRIGAVSFARVSCAHGYHGVSLIRRFLRIGFEDATIRARTFVAPLVEGGSRAGPPEQEKIVQASQLLGEFDFGDRLGLFDFTDTQYRSAVRSHRVMIRGERGEIADNEVRTLRDFRTPIVEDLRRRDRGQGGDLDGYWHEAVLLGGETLFQNPYFRARILDDEIAIATMLERMGALVRGEGAGPYAFAEAAQDQYLALLMAEAAASGEAIRTTRQPWAT